MAAEPPRPESTADRTARLDLRAEERVIVALAHFSTLVPLWALVANSLLLFTYRESSRAICFHARQGIQFQVLFLVVSVPVLLVPLLEKVMRTAHVPPPLPVHLDQVAWWVLAAVYGVYAACCLLGIAQALRGRFFLYPLTGRPLLRRWAGAARMGA